VAQKYVEAFAKLADSPQQRTLIVPADFAGIAGSIAGIAEMVGAARGETQGRGPPPPPRAPAPPDQGPYR
jgi:hypothetical protein